MRKFYFSFLSAFVLLLLNSTNTSAQTFTGANFDIPTGAPATTTGTASGTVNVSGVGVVANGANISVKVQLNHTFVNDLAMWLVSPTGEVLELQTRNGSLNNNEDVIFSNAGAQNITAVTPNTSTGVGGCPSTSYAYQGTYKPEGRVNVIPVFPASPSDAPAAGTYTFANTFSGINANGNWTLHINDHVSGDVGATCIWSITFSTPAATPCAENFDAVSAPTLPSGWSSSTTGIGVNWVTSTTTPASAPNDAFTPNATNIASATLQSRVIPIVSSGVLTFSNLFNLESGFDGMVLEISINGGPYQDILAAGGSFVSGGYNGTISTFFGSPIAGRQAWTNLSGGTTAAPSYITTVVNLPAAANGQNVQFRWIVAADNSFAAAGAAGARIDNVSIAGSNCSGDCSGTPTPGTISGVATSCSGSPVTLTLSGQTNLPGIALQWKSSNTPGGPYTAIAGANAATYTYTPTTSSTTYYIVTVTCANGGASANTPEFQQIIGSPVHTTVSSTVTTACSPGAATITGTVSGGALTGLSTLGTSGTINLAIPDGSAAGANSTIVLPATTIATAADLRIRITASHSWVGDLKFTLTSPCGTTFLFDQPGVPPLTFGNSDNLGTNNSSTPPAATYTFDLAGASIIPETSGASGFIAAGSYKPSNTAGAAHNWAGLTFPCSGAGNWVLNVADNAAGDVGTLVSWQIMGPPVYTHTLTGPGTITQNPSTGANNATANFTITNVPFGNQTYVLTSTDPIGCSVSSNVNVLIKQTPVITFTPAAPTICNGTIQQITANVVPPVIQTFNQPATTQVPAGQPTTTSGPGDPYPSTITVSGVPAGSTVKSVKLGNVNHTFPDDIDVVLVSPTGVPVILLSDIGGGTPVVGADYTIDDAAAALLADATLNASGTYKPTNFGATDAFVAPGPGSLTQATPTLASFGSGNMNGQWKLYVVDDATGAVGYIGNWSISFNVPPTVVFSPTTGLYLDAAATIPYTGTPVTTVYAKPTTTTTYTATTTVDGCSSSNTITVTVNQLPTITVQPTPATQTICPGFNVTYSVTATGTGITYQWYRNAVALTNGGQISGATSNTLTIGAVTAANSGTYTVVVSGACPPAVTSNAVVLNVATTPVISAQPANASVCVGGNATFTIGTTGSVPAPTIFQWQVSTDGGATWTNLLTGGSFTSTLTVPSVTAAMNNNRYRVIVTNSCGQTVTSSAAILTVNAGPTVTAGVLPRICLSDTLVPLVGTPVGGSWSGIGVSGFNFVPSATAVGTYTLTYTYTNAAGCTGTATTIAKVEDCPERMRLLRDDAAIIYPNPNNGRFNIKMNSSLYSYLGMRVYTTDGKQLTVKNWGGLVYGRVIPVDLSYLPGGTYMVKLYYDDGVRTAEKTFPVVISR